MILLTNVMASKVQLRHPTGNLTKAAAKAPLRQRCPTLQRKAGEGGAGANQGHTAAYAVRRPSLGKDQRPPSATEVSLDF